MNNEISLEADFKKIGGKMKKINLKKLVVLAVSVAAFAVAINVTGCNKKAEQTPAVEEAAPAEAPADTAAAPADTTTAANPQ